MPNILKSGVRPQILETRHAFRQTSDYGGCFLACQSRRTDRFIPEDAAPTSEVGGVKPLSRSAGMDFDTAEPQNIGNIDESLHSCCCLICSQKSGLSDDLHGDVTAGSKLKPWSRLSATKNLAVQRVDNSRTCQAVESRDTGVGEAYDFKSADMNNLNGPRRTLPSHGSIEGLKKLGEITKTVVMKDGVNYQNLAASLRFERVLTLGNQDEFATLQEPVGIAANSDGVIAVADLGDDLIKFFSKQGSLIRELGHYEKPNGKKSCLLCPTGLAFDSFGNLVVVERGRHRVTVITPQGKLLRGFGRRGKADGQLWLPHGVSVDSHNRIIVTDTGNSRVQVFNLEGKLLQVFGNNGEHKLDYPCYTLRHESFFYVSDTDNDCVKVFDSEGKFVRHFSDAHQSESSCRFSAPSGLAVFRDKYLLICDYNQDCVKAYTLDGKFVAKFGTPGTDIGQLSGPEALAVLPTGEVVVTDKRNRQVHLFNQICN